VIQGISHLTFIIKNLDGMESLLVQVFSAKKGYDSVMTPQSLPLQNHFPAFPFSHELKAFFKVFHGESMGNDW
jgi:hypothetical protein